VGVLHIRRLQYLVHALWSQCALHQVADGDGAHKGRKARILAFLLSYVFRKDLCWVVVRLKVYVSSVPRLKLHHCTYHLADNLLPVRKQRGILADVGLKLRCLDATFFEAVPRGSACRSFTEGTFCCLEHLHALRNCCSDLGPVI
jgi:hypothetical protein